MISKNKFVKIINTLKDYSKRQENLNKAMDALSNAYGEAFSNSFYPLNKYESIIIDLLNMEFNLKSNEYVGTDLDYFVYELNYGKQYKPGCIQDANGTNIDISTPGKLYDYLISLQDKGESKKCLL